MSSEKLFADNSVFYFLKPRDKVICYNVESLTIKEDLGKKGSPRIFTVNRLDNGMITLFSHSDQYFSKRGYSTSSFRDRFWYNHRLFPLHWYQYYYAN